MGSAIPERELVERLFDLFSKGRQEDLLPQLAGIKKPPILFVSGEEDLRYRRVGKSLSAACPAIEHVTIAGAAHRVPWDNSEVFENVVQKFINRIVPS
jgi:pimeloyl-ACP methyl ester carboxylesterase